MEVEEVIESLAEPLLLENTLIPLGKELIVSGHLNFQPGMTFHITFG
ncbi:hypothetical protein A584_26238 [Pseudomonas syringae pv. theae ICMP 3923]|nr:hypothetical protein A584_26238 [Pseudomonas syringae pv. theae ICMP 3923]